MRTFGVERERFITDSFKKIVPEIGTLLVETKRLAREKGISEDLFSYELFAGQIEDRTPPCSNRGELKKALLLNDGILSEAARKLALSFDYSEIVDPARIAHLEVNPFDDRHKDIWNVISEERKVSASIVAAVHVHLSVNEEEAVALINFCREGVIDELITLGDHSNKQRINAYRRMAETNGIPPLFSTFSELMIYINGKGDEKNVWDLVRYKPSTKTVEFRMFGATEDVEEVLRYVRACRELLFKL